MGDARIEAALWAVRDASERVSVTIADLTDDGARGPSRLPGWTRGHVLTHLGRNADGNRNSHGYGNCNGDSDCHGGTEVYADAQAAAYTSSSVRLLKGN